MCCCLALFALLGMLRILTIFYQTLSKGTRQMARFGPHVFASCLICDKSFCCGNGCLSVRLHFFGILHFAFRNWLWSFCQFQFLSSDAWRFRKATVSTCQFQFCFQFQEGSVRKNSLRFVHLYIAWPVSLPPDSWCSAISLKALCPYPFSCVLHVQWFLDQLGASLGMSMKVRQLGSWLWGWGYFWCYLRLSYKSGNRSLKSGSADSRNAVLSMMVI